MQTLGIIGGGQLARMLVLQAAALGVRCQVLDPNPDAGAGQLCQQIVADYDDIEALRALSAAVDALTYDFENVPAATLQQAKLGTKLSPGVSVLHVAQDRLKEKQLFQQLGIEVGGFHAVNSRTDLLEALDQTGYPAVLKTRRMGYDGKGQALLRQQEDLERAWQQMGGEDLILEAFITFQQEYSIIGVRNRAGEVRCYPLVQNVHEHGVLRCSRVSLAQNRRGQNSLGQNWDQLQTQAETCLHAIAEQFDYVGVLTLELFLCDGRFLANEIAPRVHNSGHWSIEAADCSQFENHLRAVLDLPLGPVTVSAEALMLNFIGTMPDAQQLLQVPGLHWHDYGKHARPGRKVGHATLCGTDLAQFRQRLQQLNQYYPEFQAQSMA